MARADSDSSPIRVLVVEDDTTIVLNIATYLESCGHLVDIAYDGPAAVGRLSDTTYDIVILDLGLPRLDGLHVLEQMRRRLVLDTPVLILTARDALDAKLQGFTRGADDYLTKPFALAELAARIAALHRRAQGKIVTDVMSAGPLRLDRRSRRVFVADEPLHLMPRSMLILERLLRDPGSVVTRSELEALLWPHDPPERDALRSQIHLLRRALCDAGYDGLRTVHGVGYRLDVIE